VGWVPLEGLQRSAISFAVGFPDQVPSETRRTAIESTLKARDAGMQPRRNAL
jgi:hypothetical protein